MSDNDSSRPNSPPQSTSLSSRTPGRSKQPTSFKTHVSHSSVSSSRPFKQSSLVESDSSPSRPSASTKLSTSGKVPISQGEIHDMDRVIGLFRYPKFYYEGSIVSYHITLCDHVLLVPYIPSHPTPCFFPPSQIRIHLATHRATFRWPAAQTDRSSQHMG